MASGKDREFEGQVDQAKGAVKEGFGALTGDRSKEIEGKAERLKGNVKEKIGALENDIDNDRLDRNIDR